MIKQTPKLSVIIPTLNDELEIRGLLLDLGRQRGLDFEVLAGDGGSTDDTLAVMQERGVQVIVAPRGRAAQLNAAIRSARGEFLLILHADSRLPSETLFADAYQALQAAKEQQGHERVAGHFPLRFLRREQGHEMAFRYIQEKTHFNRVNTTNGDQGFFLSRKFFDELGGFDDSLPFLEDQKLAEKIRQAGVWITLPGHMFTSARRFEVEGLHRRYILMSIIMGLHSAGVTSFFTRARTVYQDQGQTGHLLLWPYFKVLWEMQVQDLGWAGSYEAWVKVGRYIRQNSWQMFYFFDVACRSALGPGRYPFLNFHDKYFTPLTDNGLCDRIVSVVSFIWFMLILGSVFFFLDNGPRHGGPDRLEASKNS